MTARAASPGDLDAVVSGVLHDLRGPMANLSMTAQLLGRKAAKWEDVSELLVRADASRNRLEHLVAELADFARAGHEVARAEAEPITETITRTIGSLAARPHAVDLDGPEATLVLDHYALARIIQNLVTNAVEADPDGRVVLRWGIEPFWLEVEDRSTGLSATARARLFEPGLGTLDGHGLGLATARRLARRMGGELTLVRTGATGSCFRYEDLRPGSAALA